MACDLPQQCCYLKQKPKPYLDRSQLAEDQGGINLESKNNFKMNFVLQGDFWLAHPIFSLLSSLFCTITNFPVHECGKHNS